MLLLLLDKFLLVICSLKMFLSVTKLSVTFQFSFKHFIIFEQIRGKCSFTNFAFNNVPSDNVTREEDPQKVCREELFEKCYVDAPFSA